jgi:hypothetical protein
MGRHISCCLDANRFHAFITHFLHILLAGRKLVLSVDEDWQYAVARPGQASNTHCANLIEIFAKGLLGLHIANYLQT